MAVLLTIMPQFAGRVCVVVVGLGPLEIRRSCGVVVRRPIGMTMGKTRMISYWRCQ